VAFGESTIAQSQQHSTVHGKGLRKETTMSDLSVQACDDFYKFANRKWFEKDEPIPGDYPQWGSFHKLADNSVKAQIELLQGLEAKKKGVTGDEAKILAILRASNARFAAWEAGEGDLGDLVDQLNHVQETIGDLDNDQTYVEGLAKIFSEFHEQDIDSPFNLTPGASFEDSESMLLHFEANGLSLPTRDHYLSDSFKQQRGFFEVHLANVVGIVGEDNLVDNFAERVLRFETKLAMISMAPPQRRQYDKYFTITTLDDFVSKVNDLKYLEDKDVNFLENKQHPLVETLPDVLGTPGYMMTDADKEAFGALVLQMSDLLGLKETLVANCKKHYPDQTSEERQLRTVCFDGDYFRRAVPLLLNKEDRQDVVAFLQYKAIKAARELLTKEVDEEFFNFYDRELSGQKEQKSLEKRSVAVVNAYAGMLFGQLYVNKHFPLAEKKNLLSLINEVLAVMKTSLKSLDWMTKATRKKAVKKLGTFVPKIGFPDKWENFDELVLEEGDSLLQISRKVAAFRNKVDFLDVINSPKDKTKWFMTPQTVNAYYDPQSNEICFPAAILQPPFYYKNIKDLKSVEFDLDGIPKDTPGILDALNCGGICSVIAHEIGHGFDDQGSKYDGHGNLVNWWADEDRKQFEAKCGLMAKQVLKWQIIGEDGTVHKLKPDLVMGECLADIAGVSLGVGAMLRKLRPSEPEPLPERKKGLFASMFGAKKFEKRLELAKAALEEKKVKDAENRLNQIRLFCRGWATIWRSKSTLAYSIKLTAVDPHAPTSFRGNLISNIPEFYEAFDVPEGSDMHIPEDERVRLW